MIESPKITIVTPSFNGGKYIERCILSLMSQQYKNFEHIIVDGDSTDNTLDVIRKYEHQYSMKWISEKDKGMYDAINKGFSMATGEILAWLNADDYYFPWTLHVVARCFQCKDIDWLTGIPSNNQYFDGVAVNCQLPNLPVVYNKSMIARGYYNGKTLPFLQQESCFWSRALWEKAGAKLSSNLQFAGDYYLWKSFAKYATLYTVQCNLASFSIHDEQKTSDMDAYYKEVEVKNSTMKQFICTCYAHIYSLIVYRKYVINLMQIYACKS